MSCEEWHNPLTGQIQQYVFMCNACIKCVLTLTFQVSTEANLKLMPRSWKFVSPKIVFDWTFSVGTAANGIMHSVPTKLFLFCSAQCLYSTQCKHVGTRILIYWYTVQCHASDLNQMCLIIHVGHLNVLKLVRTTYKITFLCCIFFYVFMSGCIFAYNFCPALSDWWPSQTRAPICTADLPPFDKNYHPQAYINILSSIMEIVKSI